MFFSEEPFLGLFFSETTERRLRQEEICQRIRFLMGGCVVSIALCRRGGENPGRNEEIRSETEGQCVGGSDADARRRLSGVVVVGMDWGMLSATRRSKGAILREWDTRKEKRCHATIHQDKNERNRGTTTKDDVWS